MTLSKDEKKALSEYRMQKAREMLDDAEFNLNHGRYATSVNRSYYAVLNATKALLILMGIDPSSHVGCKTMLVMHFVKTGFMDNSYVEDFKLLLSRRTDLDYGDFETVDKDKALDSFEKASKFLKEAEKLRNEILK